MPKAATRTPPKRTRRVSAPFDDRLEVRMYSTEKAKLLDEAEQRGLSASDLVRFQLGDLIAAAPPVQNVPEVPDEPPVDLLDAIEDSGLMPRGKAILKLHMGRITVGDSVWGMSEIPENLLPQVRVDGVPLPPLK